MAWFKGEIDYAGERLERAVEHGVERLDGVLRESIDQAGSELRQVVEGAGRELRDVVEDAGREVDARLAQISRELHDQRRFTREDVRELVDYAAQSLGQTLDQRVVVLREEFAGLMQEKVEYLKSEVDAFFIERQRDLARERRRLLLNIVLAAGASIGVGLVSLGYRRYAGGGLDLLDLFRGLFAALVTGYGVWLLVRGLRRWNRWSEHRKDLTWLSLRYFGPLSPAGLALHGLVLLILLLLGLLLFLPGPLAAFTGLEWLGGLAGAGISTGTATGPAASG